MSQDNLPSKSHLLELIESLSESYRIKDTYGINFECVHCAEEEEDGKIPHAADCPIREAQQLLGKEIK